MVAFDHRRPEVDAGSRHDRLISQETFSAGDREAYSIGGTVSPTATGEPAAVSSAGGELVLTAIVRTNDPGLKVTGEVAEDGTLFDNPASISEVTGSAAGVSQAGVPHTVHRQWSEIHAVAD